MYRIEKKENYILYIFNKIDLKIKVSESNLLKKVYIILKGYNPLFSMLLGNFADECEFYSLIKFDAQCEINGKTNTLYCIIKKDDLDIFIEEIYSFIIENDVGNTLNDSDKVIWSF